MDDRKSHRRQSKPEPGAQVVSLDIWDGASHLTHVAGVALHEDGSFDIRMKEYLNSRGAMRLEMKGEGLQASGWLNVEYELSADDRERSLARASTRVLGVTSI